MCTTIAAVCVAILCGASVGDAVATPAVAAGRGCPHPPGFGRKNQPQVIFELHRHFFAHQRLEKGDEELHNDATAGSLSKRCGHTDTHTRHTAHGVLARHEYGVCGCGLAQEYEPTEAVGRTSPARNTHAHLCTRRARAHTRPPRANRNLPRLPRAAMCNDAVVANGAQGSEAHRRTTMVFRAFASCSQSGTFNSNQQPATSNSDRRFHSNASSMAAGCGSCGTQWHEAGAGAGAVRRARDAQRRKGIQ